MLFEIKTDMPICKKETTKTESLQQIEIIQAIPYSKEPESLIIFDKFFTTMEEFKAIVTKPEADEEFKEIQANLDSMQTYFAALQKAEDKFEKFFEQNDE